MYTIHSIDSFHSDFATKIVMKTNAPIFWRINPFYGNLTLIVVYTGLHFLRVNILYIEKKTVRWPWNIIHHYAKQWPNFFDHFLNEIQNRREKNCKNEQNQPNSGKNKQIDRLSCIQAFSNFIHFIKFLERFFFLKQRIILICRKPDTRTTYPFCLKTQLKRNKTNFLNSLFYVCLRIIHFNPNMWEWILRFQRQTLSILI